jgi:hypothetical protein
MNAREARRSAFALIVPGLLIFLAAAPASAAVVIDKLTARPAPPRSAKGYPQEVEFEITIKDGGVTRILGCDLSLDFGDGTPQVHQHFTDGGARRVTVKHVYDAPGTYTAVARGKVLPGARACDGERRTQVEIAGEAPAPERTAGEAAQMGTGCPAGWSLVTGSQSGYRFKCRAERLTPKIECQGGTKYFEQDGVIGCQ